MAVNDPPCAQAGARWLWFARDRLPQGRPRGPGRNRALCRYRSASAARKPDASRHTQLGPKRPMDPLRRHSSATRLRVRAFLPGDAALFEPRFEVPRFGCDHHHSGETDESTQDAYDTSCTRLRSEHLRAAADHHERSN